jgi:hypothetical protein
MRPRIATFGVTIGLLAFGAAGAYAGSGGHVPGSGPDRNAGSHQYGTVPGKGCGDRNHVHTGPPGNPSNTACPPQSQHQGSAGTTATPKTHKAKACKTKVGKHASRKAKRAAKKCRAAKAKHRHAAKSHQKKKHHS